MASKMIEKAEPKQASIPRRWHMIDEIDLVRTVAEHTAWLRLCARLEAIADALPALPAADELAVLRAQILGLVEPDPAQRDCGFELPLGRNRVGPGPTAVPDGFRRARAARAIDVEDIIAALAPAADCEPSLSATALGYMLRSFFQGCRAAVAMEQLALIALGGERLTEGARALLLDRLNDHPWT